MTHKKNSFEKIKEFFYLNKGLINMIRREYKEDIFKSRNHENIKKFFSMSKEGEYTIDDQTWKDLDMDKVFDKLDRNYSSLGEGVLYYMLRNPLMEEGELIDRSSMVESLKNNSRLRERLLCIFFGLNRDRKNSFLNMLEQDFEINKFKYYLYTFIGQILPVIIVLLTVFVNVKALSMLVLLSFLTVYINANERNKIKSNGILYMGNIIRAGRKIALLKDEDIKLYTSKIISLLDEIKEIDKGTKFIRFTNLWDGVFEFISVIFLIEESAYYGISDKIKNQKDTLLEIYKVVGELEALISIAGYQSNLKHGYVKPRFVKEVSLNIAKGIHPLIDRPVPNSINISNKGIVLTGTNMSGKSTFLRMLGVNILLAQTFYFVLSEEYEAPFFNIVSSISPEDDLTRGKSFYMAEAEALLRIINAMEKEAPVFCPIDEIFRGTNPVERIAMSAEILTYIKKGKTISIVATHDRELADILREDYEFYHFSEVVDSSKGLCFDYMIKKGVSKTRNAIRLLDYIGYPKVIIDRANKRAEGIEGFI